MKKLIFLLFFSLSFLGFAQQIQLSPKAEISVITCGPGTNELYASFGHSAFRVLDLENKIDRVYNYGTFDFDTPNFYLKFSRGKLLYQLRAYNFGNFLRSYHRENRWVKGQVLDLNQEQVQKVYDFLEENALPENRSYKYDFFYDNCSTKLYDVLEEVLGDKLVFKANFDQEDLTHRDLIELYMDHQPWADFGIDLALGADIDRKASSREYMFLPDYVFEAFEEVEIKKEDEGSIQPIVKRTEEILLSYKGKSMERGITPFLVFSLVALIIVAVTYRDYKKEKRSKILDVLIFAVTGSVGLILLLLWFATDHSATANNFNVLWAFAPNLIFLFLTNKNAKMNQHYLLTLLLLLDIMVLLWIFRVQVFHYALIPLMLGLYIRYIFLWVRFRKESN
ncbi:DUF4105 domain-containing protein [Lutimonas saemankumensis]|uniref:lipoprotein N-acyltransferase Lnb domain-containing protein n=1 Tax=Lutimonas saemankumensis TaxID=483016 RepID=UPI001CD236AB|nr:DUF4105 domain-containing protein [Lutimonas saemankumensis]MCA0931605.1 DUF4105 domain-containing protein [Lutimonas saemankumensis]